jgi:hypothetical protein
MAGNKNSGKRPGGKDFSPRVRSLFDRALEKFEKTGDAEVAMQKALQDDFIGTLQRMAAYAPKQVDMSLEQVTPVDTTALSPALLKEMFEERMKRDSEGSDKRIH